MSLFRLIRMMPVGRGCGAALVGALLAGPLPAADWQTLVANNPFGAAAGPAAAPAAADQLEFRGVLQEEGIVLVNLYDPATKQAQWIPVDSSAGGLTVTSYDAASGSVSLQKSGQPLTLALKQAKVSLLALPPPTPAATPGPAATTAAGDSPENRRAQFARNLPPEAQAMIEEIRRRRALRQQGQAPVPGQTVPTPVNRPRQQ